MSLEWINVYGLTLYSSNDIDSVLFMIITQYISSNWWPLRKL